MKYSLCLSFIVATFLGINADDSDGCVEIDHNKEPAEKDDLNPKHDDSFQSQWASICEAAKKHKVRGEPHMTHPLEVPGMEGGCRANFRGPAYAKATCTTGPGRIVCRLGRYTFVINNGDHKMEPEVVERFAAMLYHRTQEGDNSFDISVDTPVKEEAFLESPGPPMSAGESCPLVERAQDSVPATQLPVYVECNPVRDERKMCDPAFSPTEVIYSCKRLKLGIGKRQATDPTVVLPYRILKRSTELEGSNKTQEIQKPNTGNNNATLESDVKLKDKDIIPSLGKTEDIAAYSDTSNRVSDSPSLGCQKHTLTDSLRPRELQENLRPQQQSFDIISESNGLETPANLDQAAKRGENPTSVRKIVPHNKDGKVPALAGSQSRIDGEKSLVTTTSFSEPGRKMLVEKQVGDQSQGPSLTSEDKGDKVEKAAFFGGTKQINFLQKDNGIKVGKAKTMNAGSKGDHGKNLELSREITEKSKNDQNADVSKLEETGAILSSNAKGVKEESDGIKTEQSILSSVAKKKTGNNQNLKQSKTAAVHSSKEPRSLKVGVAANEAKQPFWRDIKSHDLESSPIKGRGIKGQFEVSNNLKMPNVQKNEAENAKDLESFQLPKRTLFTNAGIAEGKIEHVTFSKDLEGLISLKSLNNAELVKVDGETDKEVSNEKVKSPQNADGQKSEMESLNSQKVAKLSNEGKKVIGTQAQNNGESKANITLFSDVKQKESSSHLVESSKEIVHTPKNKIIENPNVNSANQVTTLVLKPLSKIEQDENILKIHEDSFLPETKNGDLGIRDEIIGVNSQMNSDKQSNYGAHDTSASNLEISGTSSIKEKDINDISKKVGIIENPATEVHEEIGNSELKEESSNKDSAFIESSKSQERNKEADENDKVNIHEGQTSRAEFAEEMDQVPNNKEYEIVKIKSYDPFASDVENLAPEDNPMEQSFSLAALYHQSAPAKEDYFTDIPSLAFRTNGASDLAGVTRPQDFRSPGVRRRRSQVPLDWPLKRMLQARLQTRPPRWFKRQANGPPACSTNACTTPKTCSTTVTCPTPSTCPTPCGPALDPPGEVPPCFKPPPRPPCCPPPTTTTCPTTSACPTTCPRFPRVARGARARPPRKRRPFGRQVRLGAAKFKQD